MKKRNKKNHTSRSFFLALASIFFFISAISIIWVATIKIPDFKSFESRLIARSTKIYDRTGKILLYDLHQDIKRTEIPFDTMGINIKNATVALEDSEFYNHSGIRLTSIIRAILVNLFHGNFSQGGSTITQQIIKNSLLTKDKTIVRKIKEWILSFKIEQTMSKEEILTIYLNEAPYGGSIYGIDEASRTYFNKPPTDLTLAEAGYLASIPKAPTFYSPYGKNLDKLDERKNLALTRMHELNFITDEEYDNAKNEKITFTPAEKTGIKAPHFVFFVKEYLEQKYGTDQVATAGLKVTTTLDYDLQQKAEEIVKKYALENEKKYKAKNAGLVTIDPKTGQILVMVGSRDYFDTTIDGNYNIATAKRQPGSAFKPFVYSAGFNLGYTPDTVLFDLPTEFSTRCSIYGKPLNGGPSTDCYMPQNFDGKYNGPLTIREALARSINIPAVKMLYLVGIDEAVKTAEELGIKTLGSPDKYGLTLVLGGGEVRLIDMTSAYGVFAVNGVRHPYQSVMRVEDANGATLEEYTDTSENVLPKNTALMISDILTDNDARAPTFGKKSSLYFSDRQVAVKTGTTNDFKDAWVVGYTPSIVVGAWVGNNDNTPMAEYTSSMLSAPLWHEFMNYLFTKIPKESFEKPEPSYEKTVKPVFRGHFEGGESFTIDTISGKLATESTPLETQKEKIITNVHDILYWVNKDDPRGEKPINPYNDPEFSHWEAPVASWWATNSYKYTFIGADQKPTGYDTIHVLENKPHIDIINPLPETRYDANSPITAKVKITSVYPAKKVDYFLNDKYLGSSSSFPFSFSFTPNDISAPGGKNELKTIAYDSYYNSNEAFMEFLIDR